MAPCSPSSAATCSFLLGLVYSNARITTPQVCDVLSTCHEYHNVRLSSRNRVPQSRTQTVRCTTLWDYPAACCATLYDYPRAPPSSASSTRAGVSGRKGTRTPMALATALEMAAPGETTGGSASPITPRSS